MSSTYLDIIILEMPAKQNNPLHKLLKLSLDLLVIVFLFYLFLWIHTPTVPKNLDGLWIFTYSQFKSLGLFILSWLLISQQVKFYGVVAYFSERVKKIIFQIFLFSIVILAVSGIKTDYLYTNEESAYFIIILVTYLFVSRGISWLIIKFKEKSGSKHKTNVLIIGKNNNSESFIEVLTDKLPDYNIISFLVTHPQSQKEERFSIDQFKETIHSQKIEHIYIAMFADLEKEQINKVIEIAEKKYIPFEFIPQSYLEQYESFDIKYYDTFPIFALSRYPLDGVWNQAYKRIFDVVFSILVITLIMSWLYPVIALSIIIDSGFPVLYKQKRNGLQGNFFNCLKFRSMRPSKDNDKKATVRGDTRITKIGKFLRKSSIDELPQFFNVLKGEMSVVGPRPHMVTQDEYYANLIHKYTLRHYVKPGITGLAQVKGYRGEVNSDQDMELRIRADIFYVKNWSFWLDLAIIAKTASKMVLGDKNAI